MSAAEASRGYVSDQSELFQLFAAGMTLVETTDHILMLVADR
jgi:high-affinity nickel permease